VVDGPIVPFRDRAVKAGGLGPFPQLSLDAADRGSILAPEGFSFPLTPVSGRNENGAMANAVLTVPESYLALDDESIAFRIREAKRELGRSLVILGHHYQRDDVIEHSDITGDSYKLALEGSKRTDARWIVFDSSKVGVAPLSPGDALYATYGTQLRMAIELASRSPVNFFLDHHPILGFAPNPTRTPTGLYPGNGSLQSVLLPIQGERLFPDSFQALVSGHVHLFEVVSYLTDQSTQLISGNAGAWADVPLPHDLPRGATPLPGAVIGSIVSTNQSGFTIIERDSEGGWRVEARDRHGRLFTTCTLRDRKTRCVPETLP